MKNKKTAPQERRAVGESRFENNREWRKYRRGLYLYRFSKKLLRLIGCYKNT